MFGYLLRITFPTVAGAGGGGLRAGDDSSVGNERIIKTIIN